MKPEGPFERGRGGLLLRVRDQNTPVDVHRDQPILRDRAAARPRRRPGRGPGRPDRGHRRAGVDGETVDQPAHRRVRRDRAEQLRLRPDDPDVSQTVPAERDRRRQIQQHLPRLMPRTRRPPRPEPGPQAPGHPGRPSRLHQQRTPRRRHQRPAADHDPNPTRTRSTLHLRGAFLAAEPWTFSKPSFPARTGTSVQPRPGVTHPARLHAKARG